MPLVVITGTYQSISVVLVCQLIHEVELLDDMNISAHARPAMQWEEHSSIEARQLAGGGDWQEGRPRLGGADAGRPHQEPGEIPHEAGTQ